jgi:hypothetical protein
MEETTRKEEVEFVDLLLTIFKKYPNISTETKSRLLNRVFFVLENEPRQVIEPREMRNPPDRKNLIAEHRILQLRESGKSLPDILYDPNSKLTIRRNCIKLMRYETRTF